MFKQQIKRTPTHIAIIGAFLLVVFYVVGSALPTPAEIAVRAKRQTEVAAEAKKRAEIAAEAKRAEAAAEAKKRAERAEERAADERFNAELREANQRAAVAAKKLADDAQKGHPELHADGAAFYRAQEYVKARLKAPSTADFQSLFTADVRNLGSGKYQVISWVDAQNGFGAQIRTHFICSLETPDGHRWAITKFTTW
jgi:hypothetical protein